MDKANTQYVHYIFKSTCLFTIHRLELCKQARFHSSAEHSVGENRCSCPSFSEWVYGTTAVLLGISGTFVVLVIVIGDGTCNIIHFSVVGLYAHYVSNNLVFVKKMLNGYFGGTSELWGACNV